MTEERHDDEAGTASIADPDAGNVDRLTDGDREILLVGTAHVSRESAELVRRIIAKEKPDTVCVELCASRYQALRQRDQWREMDIVKVVREKKSFLLLANLLLASFQRRVAQKLDVVPGQEMMTAVESAEAVGAAVHLADREIRVTLSRAWRTLRFRDKVRLLVELLTSAADVEEITEEDIEKMKERDMLEAILAEVGRDMPALKAILIDERDRYLAEKIRTAPGRRVVAVVGAGHVPGIQAQWGTPVELPPLEEVPPPGRMTAVMTWALPLAILVLFVWGFFMGGAKAGMDMALYWIAVTGLLSGLGALAALAHPLTILSAAAAAPLTTLHPMIAAGWVSGLVEAVLRKPKVLDFERLSEDILSIRGFWRNKVTRVLLVVVFTNIGASIGTFVAIPLMLRVMG